ncbi:amino acid ABC transporter permease [Amycolatopsis pithecellobii]|uniref:ABC transporter permease subunit n=1 Tax=Amycolatopsis pithecellobii TaxID=664692 RepID=A0A6N7Z4R5_9PSEU|nr:amino acid ABC transporter permease [Amycolatopsis pithecellobii]MTD54266.1 ABC transporter permease subunit [Amycolatopsis pithecellobii]
MSDFWAYLPQMLEGTVTALEIGTLGTAAALVAGMLLAVARQHAPAIVRALVAAYVELIRGTPPILQLFILYFGLTQFGVFLSAWTAGLLWLIAYGAGYAVEIFRAGLAAVPTGQTEAAAALGLSSPRTLTAITLPQTVTAMLPALTNFIIIQLKSTSILYVIGVQELLAHAQNGASNTHQPLAIYAIAGAIYIILNVAISRAVAYLRGRLVWMR